MKITRLNIPEVIVIEPEVFEDERGFFFESFNQNKFNQALGRDVFFVQDNHSKSKYGVLRGLHYQEAPFEQAKLIRVISGEIFDVAVDIRVESQSYGQWVACELSAQNKKQLWIPEGFAHGFLVLSSEAQVVYKTNNFYNLDLEKTIPWNNNSFNIHWPLNKEFIITSKKDAC
jgi:dTDP-4-dehydrorhamnose 3,5-epimerase